ncbi:flavodoxin family protein [Cysteiniphilum sp. 6C5]|uniref:flavodoxin family protein n=1 Tax=unclassified Cysteiniphilum TaxID=2610889 RepID=UPI003F8786A3
MKKIVVTIISGSERRGGNSDSVVSYLDGYFQNVGCLVHSIFLSEKEILPCGSCGDCNYRSSPCSLDDDVTSIVDYLVDSNIIIYVAPVHAFGMAHKMQIFLERAGVGYLRFNRPLADKLGGCVVVGRRYNLGNVHDQLLNNFLLNRMIVPGSGYPALVHGGESGGIWDDEEGVSAINQLMERLYSLAISMNLQRTDELCLIQNERVAVENNSKMKV